MQARWADPEWRAARSAGVKKQWEDPEYRAAVAAGLEGARDKQREAASAQWSDPQFRERNAEGTRRFLAAFTAACIHCGADISGRGPRARTCEGCRARHRAWVRRTIPQLIVRDGPACGICGIVIDFALAHPDRSAATVDHVVPVSKGGTSDLPNLQLAHRRCNEEKGDE